jgi:hypothetical protein
VPKCRRRRNRQPGVNGPHISRPAPKEPAQADSSDAAADYSGSSYNARRGAKWLTGTAATAALTAAVTLMVTKAGDKAVEPSSPIAVNLVADPAEIPAFADTLQQMAVPAHPAATVPQPQQNMCAAGGFRDWARGVGGADWKDTRVRLQLQGHSTKPVLVSGVTVHVLARRPAGQSVVLECQPSGQLSPRVMALDLDAGHPMARDVRDGRSEPFHGYTLNNGEQEIFDITASTSRPEIIDWYLQLSLVADGKAISIDIQDHGKPLRTTAVQVADEHRYAWRAHGGSYWINQKTFQRVTSPF